MVSVFIPQNLHNGVSDVLYILNLTEFVRNACSWAANTMHSVFFLRNSFFSHLHDSPVPFFSTFCWKLHAKLSLSSSFSLLHKFFYCSLKDSSPPEAFSQLSVSTITRLNILCNAFFSLSLSPHTNHFQSFQLQHCSLCTIIHSLPWSFWSFYLY